MTLLAIAFVGCGPQESQTPDPLVIEPRSEPVVTQPEQPIEDGGLLKIEVAHVSPSTIISIDGNEYSAHELVQPVTLTTDQHTVVVKRDGRELERHTVTISPGKRSVLRLSGPNQKAVEWVLGIGGRVRIAAAGRERNVEDFAELPTTFTVTQIDVSAKAFDDSDLELLDGLEGLQYLGIRFRPITDTGLAHVRGLSKLWEISAEGTSITDAGLAHVKDLTNLSILRLDDTRISDTGLAHIENLNLQIINLGRTRVTGAGLKSLSRMSHLRMIWATGSQIADDGLEHLAGLTQLTHLGLSNTPTSDAGIAKLKTLANLQQIQLKGTKVTDAGIADFQAALPNCSVLR